jgi:hypothetical protein
MAANLASEADAAGDGKESRKYLLMALKENEQHLLTAFKAPTQYYEDHFPTSIDRWWALFRFVLSRTNGFLWGYGERGLALLRSVFLVTFIMWPFFFFLTQGSIENGAGHEASIGDWFWLSAASIVGNSGATGLTAVGFARMFVLAEGAAGLLLLGLFVTYVYRYVTRR